MTLNNTLYAPQWTADNYLGLSGSQLQQTGLADNWQFGGSFTKIMGRHTIKAGGDFQTNNFRSPIAYSESDFRDRADRGPRGTAGPGRKCLGIPVARCSSCGRLPKHSRGGRRRLDRWDLRSGSVQSDEPSYRQCRIPQRHGVDADLRDRQRRGNYYTGNANPITGQYELNALPPNCSATQGAPCIPTGIYTASSTPAPGGLPPNAYVNPASDHRVIKNSLDDWAPRLGLAYRLGDKTVIRASYSRFYDAWATIVQLSQNFGGNWPAVNTIQNNGLNLNIPTAPANDPLALGSGGAIIYPINDFSQVSQWMVDPNFRTPYMDQWNVGIQRQLPANIRSRCQLRRFGRQASGLGSDHEYASSGTWRLFRPGGRTPTCCSNGSTRASETAVTTPCRSPSTNAPAMALPSWSPTRCRIRTTTAAAWVQTATRRIRTTGASTTAPQTSTRRTRSQRHSPLQSPFTTNLPTMGLQSGWRMGAQWHCARSLRAGLTR